jgi:putative ATP-binding cassette transporter
MAFLIINRFKNYISDIRKKGSEVVLLLKPYFRFEKRNYKNLFLLAAIITLCIIRAFLILLLSDIGTTWFALFNAEALILNSIIVPTLILFGLYIPLDALSDSLISYCASSLSNNVAKQMNNDYFKQFFTKSTFHGTKILDPQKTHSNKIYIEVLSKNIKQFTSSLVEPSVTMITAFVGASVSLYQLFYLSPGLQLFASVTVPFYLPLLAVCYGVVSFVILHQFTKPIHNLSRQENKLVQKNQSHLYYCDNHSESIAMLKGGKFEAQQLRNFNDQRYDTRQAKLKYKFGREFIKKLGELVSYPLGALVCIPGLIQGMTTFILDRNNFFAISTHFTKILSFVNGFAEHHDKWIAFSNAHRNMQAFNERTNEWQVKQIELKDNIKETNHLGFEGSIHLKNSNVLHNQKIKIAPGRTYLLSAPSGAGKSTLLKTFARINPHFSGKIKLPKKTVFVPQNPYFLKHDSSLLANIAYPNKPEQYPLSLLVKIPKWLTKLKIKRHIIADLRVQKKNWDQLLSQGEKQRIAIIRAILQQPECLIMDEPTSAMGPNYAKLVKDLIRAELPNATILYTDHNPTTGYPDENVIELSSPKIKAKHKPK